MRAKFFWTIAVLGIGCGIPIMFISGSAVQRNPEIAPLGLAATSAGWAMLILGCVHLMRAKGYSGWLGLLGYLLLPGVLALVILPNRRKRRRDAVDVDGVPEDTFSERDRRSGIPYLVTLLPLVVLSLAAGAFVLSLGKTIDPSAWEVTSAPELGFRAMMPGRPREEPQTQETPAGLIEMRKFSVMPPGSQELFMVVMIRFPEEIVTKLGGISALLDVAEKDLVASSKGSIQSKQAITRNGHSGLELVILPAAGAKVRARLYATRNSVYQVLAHTSMSRSNSSDVQKYLDSFEIVE